MKDPKETGEAVGAEPLKPIELEAFVSPPRVAVNEQLKPTIFDLEKRGQEVPSVIVTPPGFTMNGTQKFIEDFERTQPIPFRRRGIYTAASVLCLLDWMKKHCPEGSPVFGQGAENLATEWAKPKLSLIGIGNYSAGADMKQSEFAEFVEKHLYEFSEPLRNEDIGEACTRMIEALGGSKRVAKPGDMYDVSRGVNLTVSDKVEVSLDIATGEQTLRHTEEHTGRSGQPTKIPKFFYIRLPIFFGEEPSLIGVLLRYRNAGGGSVMWAYELFAPDLVVNAAFDRACAVVKTANRTLYLGTPDTP